MKGCINHYFKTPRPVAQAAKDVVGQWLADGFRELTDDEANALPHAATAFVGWIGPFPEGARYFVEQGTIALALEQRGDAVWTTNGTIGKSFSELQNVTHHADEKAAAKDFAQQIAQYEKQKKHYAPIDRAALVALYAKKKAR
jgi:hypothetical protein